MNQLIPTHENDSGNILVSGRDLHEFLEIGTEYAKWISRMVEYGFEENVDFVVIVKNDENSLVGRKSADHHLKIDMAKEISMIQRNEKGKQARKYFIEVEKKFKSQPNTTQLSPQLQFMIQMEQRQNALETTVSQLSDGLTAVPNHTKVVDTVNEYARWTRLGHNEIYNKVYDILKDQHGIDVRQRVENERERIQSEYHERTGKWYAESTLKKKANGIDVMVRIGCLDKFQTILSGMLAKEKIRNTLSLVR